jgi:hypothetical protein
MLCSSVRPLRCTILTWHYNHLLLLLTNAYNSLSRHLACFVHHTGNRTAALRHESCEHTATETRLVQQLQPFMSITYVHFGHPVSPRALPRRHSRYSPNIIRSVPVVWAHLQLHVNVGPAATGLVRISQLPPSSLQKSQPPTAHDVFP